MTRKTRHTQPRHARNLTLACLLAPFLTLQACTHPRPTPQPHGQEAALIPPTTTLTLSDKTTIPIRIWAASHPKAVILALHGYGDSRDAWEWPAPTLADSAITTIAPDQRGFGQAPKRGQWPGTRRMVQDTIEEANWVHTHYPTLPLYLMGESMGAATALLATTRPGISPIAGTILVSPAVLNIDPASRTLLNLITLIAPDWTFTGEDVPIKVIPTTNIAAMRRLYFDPLTLKTSRLDSVTGLVSLMATASHTPAPARTPLLILYGDQDQLVPQGPMASFWRRTPTARHDLIPGGHHLLLRDRPIATTDILSWIEHPTRPLPSGGDIAAAAWIATDPYSSEYP